MNKIPAMDEISNVQQIAAKLIPYSDVIYSLLTDIKIYSIQILMSYCLKNKFSKMIHNLFCLSRNNSIFVLFEERQFENKKKHEER